MKRIILSLVIILAMSSSLQAQELKPEINKQFMQVTTVESVVAGGIGRSKMIITHADGSQKRSRSE